MTTLIESIAKRMADRAEKAENLGRDLRNGLIELAKLAKESWTDEDVKIFDRLDDLSQSRPV